MTKLTKEQKELFYSIKQELRRETALAYVNNGFENKTKAYLSACEKMGRAPSKNPETSASEMLSYPNVIEFLNSIKEKAAEEAQITAEWVLKSAKKVFDRCMQSEPILTSSGSPVMVKTDDGELAAAYKFDSTGANKSLEIIGKHIDIQAFKTVVENKVIIQDMTDDELDRELAKLTKGTES